MSDPRVADAPDGGAASTELVRNAVRAGEDAAAPLRSVIVCGSGQEADFWQEVLRQAPAGADAPQQPRTPRVVVERGRKGNFLGCLDAYARASIGHGTAGDPAPVDQMIMLFGSGTRLSPFTQALGNMKSAFPLPHPGRPAGTYTVGEAAMRSNAPIVDALRAGGFDGLVVRWGDELYVPSCALGTAPDRYADVDVVRFGWRTDPDSALASQKEWLVTDRRTGVVVRDVPRQPLGSLRQEIAGTDVVDPDVYVNLGSFAASHEFLQLLTEAFADELATGTTPVNWDPSLWVALQCDDAAAWEALCRREAEAGRHGLQALADALPSFHSRVQVVRQRVRERHGRDVRVGVLDFGEPYWLDAGSHARLGEAMAAVFSAGPDGQAVRALLGLPDSLAHGGSLVTGSAVAPGTRVVNSVVIGAEVRDPSSVLEGAVVLGGRHGLLRVSPGGAVITCVADRLTVDGPHGVAFRLVGDATVGGGEAVSTIVAEGRELRLRYDATLGVIDDDTFSRPVLDNPVSYAEAAQLARGVHPLALQQHWSRLQGTSG